MNQFGAYEERTKTVHSTRFFALKRCNRIAPQWCTALLIGTPPSPFFKSRFPFSTYFKIFENKSKKLVDAIGKNPDNGHINTHMTTGGHKMPTVNLLNLDDNLLSRLYWASLKSAKIESRASNKPSAFPFDCNSTVSEYLR